MALYDIVVHIDHNEGCEKRVQLACGLAQRHKASLTGLYVNPGVDYPVALFGANPPANILQILDERKNERSAEAESLFNRVCKAAGVEGRLRVEEGNPLYRLTYAARYSDLVVMGQDVEHPADPREAGHPDAVIIDSGRPVLIVPYVGAEVPADGTAVVAWSGSREGARALHDSMSLLHACKHVEVVTFNPEETEDRIQGGSGRAIAELLQKHLAPSGVKVVARELSSGDLAVGDALISHLTDVGANLLVMGGYGHSRFRELLLGGPSRSVLKHMTAPVLMSH